MKEHILSKKKWEDERLYLNELLVAQYKQFDDSYFVASPLVEPARFNTESEAVAFCEAELEKYVEGLLS